MFNLDIKYEDSDIIVCVKPAGVATQTKRMGQQDMESLLRNYRASKGEDTYIGVVHRLDQPVEGIMVFAKNKKASAELNRQIAKHGADKYYMAVCSNTEHPFKENDEGELVDYLLRDGRTNSSSVVDSSTKDAKKAELKYRVIKADKERAIVQVKLGTGRHHQIRVQFANAGHPLIGDQKYGKGVRGMNVALCSCRIGFEHPSTKKKMEFEIEPTNEQFRTLAMA